MEKHFFLLQAVRRHAAGTGGAARHAGCSGQMRPCVTARRRRQGSVGQVRECTGPAMPQHTYTQRAHNTHSPARLPLPVGRHPGLLPFGNSAFGTARYNKARQSTKARNANRRPNPIKPSLAPKRKETRPLAWDTTTPAHHTLTKAHPLETTRVIGRRPPCIQRAAQEAAGGSATHADPQGGPTSSESDPEPEHPTP